MSEQISLFAPLAPIINLEPVDSEGSVLTSDEAVEVLGFGHIVFLNERRQPSSRDQPEMKIELAKHTDGRWMWARSCTTNMAYSGYRVGPKWGKFAATRGDAIWAACQELRAFVQKHPAWKQQKAALKWLERMEFEAQD